MSKKIDKAEETIETAETKVEEVVVPETPAEFSREKLIKSKRYSGLQRDLVAAVLKEDKYTLEDADAALEKYFGAEAMFKAQEVKE